MSALDDLRGVIRIARAANVGVAGGSQRIERAELALSALTELVRTVDCLITRDATVIAGDICLPMPGSSAEAREALSAALAALARCKGGAA